MLHGNKCGTKPYPDRPPSVVSLPPFARTSRFLACFSVCICMWLPLSLTCAHIHTLARTCSHTTWRSAGAVEGYVPGTGRVGMAAAAAAAAARKAAAAGESAYKAAAAAAAAGSDAAASEAKVGPLAVGGVEAAGGSTASRAGQESTSIKKDGAGAYGREPSTSRTEASSVAQQRPAARGQEGGVCEAGAAGRREGGMGEVERGMSALQMESVGNMAAPAEKRVRFAEHDNFKFLFDANAPCR